MVFMKIIFSLSFLSLLRINLFVYPNDLPHPATSESSCP